MMFLQNVQDSLPLTLLFGQVLFHRNKPEQCFLIRIFIFPLLNLYLLYFFDRIKNNPPARMNARYVLPMDIESGYMNPRSKASRDHEAKPTSSHQPAFLSLDLRVSYKDDAKYISTLNWLFLHLVQIAMSTIQKAFLSAPYFAVVGASKDKSKYGTRVRTIQTQGIENNLNNS